GSGVGEKRLRRGDGGKREVSEGGAVSLALFLHRRPFPNPTHPFRPLCPGQPVASNARGSCWCCFFFFFFFRFDVSFPAGSFPPPPPATTTTTTVPSRGRVTQPVGEERRSAEVPTHPSLRRTRETGCRPARQAQEELCAPFPDPGTDRRAKTKKQQPKKTPPNNNNGFLLGFLWRIITAVLRMFLLGLFFLPALLGMVFSAPASDSKKKEQPQEILLNFPKDETSLNEMLQEVEELMEDTQYKLTSAVREVRLLSGELE
uniref:Uncharacterized protein n=1 Tax=Laticauda laticaudata TaxID=8630 RepID=A0A8C5RTS1_LATLA